MKPNQEMIFSLVRHSLTAAGGGLVSKGLLDGTELEQAVGAILALLGVGWSLWQKWQAKKHAAQIMFPAILLLSFSLAGCQTTPPEQKLLSLSEAKIILIDSAMVGWSVHVHASHPPADQVDQVRDLYQKYYSASLVEKAAWIGWVKGRGSKSDVERARAVIMELRQPLLNLIIQWSTSDGRSFDTEISVPSEIPVTLEQVEAAYLWLRPYSAFGIP